MKSHLRFDSGIYLATLYQLAVAFLLLWLTRFWFAAYNADSVAAGSTAELLRLSLVGMRFDLSALVYFNALFILIRFLPFGWTASRPCVTATNWLYGITNGIMLAVNIGDIPYYRFTGARLRMSNLRTIATDGSLGETVTGFFAEYWWAYLGAAAVIALMVWLALRVRIRPGTPVKSPWVRTGVTVAAVALSFIAIRGHLQDGKPLSIADAALACKTPQQINIVLNSPFCVLRSMDRGKQNTVEQMVFFSDAQLAGMRNDLNPGFAPKGERRNFMLIIIESGGAEWIDSLRLIPETGHGLMPFLDSIATRSVVLPRMTATSRMSIGGATSLMMGIPSFDNFYFMLSPYNSHPVDSPARLLAQEGWDTAFFYGCNTGSYYIEQTAFNSGFAKLHNRQTFADDSQFDGIWGIYDYPMAQYVADALDGMSRPFFAAWFTVSAHGPFTLPDGWDTSGYKHQDESPERALEYTDESIRHFFDLASRQPWYNNTTFIITADHGNRDFKGTEFDNLYIRNQVPFIVYTPDGSLEPRRLDDRFASQIDLGPTVLSLAGYPHPFVALGTDILDDNVRHEAIHRTDGDRFVYFKMPYAVISDPQLQHVEELHDITADPWLKQPLPITPATDTLLNGARALMQSYTTRLVNNRLSAN